MSDIRAAMGTPVERGGLRKALRLALVAGFVVGGSFAVPHAARAQGNSDDAHELCAQGGGVEESGAGGGNLGPSFNPDDPANETAAFGNGTGGSEDEGGRGGGGPGGGLGGAEGIGGGAGGCMRDVQEVVERPVIVRRPIVVRRRNLPVTGSPAENIAYMGGTFVLAGGALLAANRRRVRLAHAAAEGLVWDAFGGARARAAKFVSTRGTKGA